LRFFCVLGGRPGLGAQIIHGFLIYVYNGF
jgi:hypothetical protein